MRRLVIPIASVLLASGCASRPAPLAQNAATAPATQPAPQPADPSRLTLDQIKPIPLLPPAHPATQPSQPPLDAIQLFAQARAALDQGGRARAIALLRSAIEKDPASYVLHESLGMAYLGSGSGNDQAIRELQRALEIDPDHIDTQFHLGRAYLAKGEIDNALLHLRLALQTRGYKTQDDYAALVNFFLARVLQQKGYDQAALDQYRQLLLRMETGLSMRGNHELFYYLSRPELIYLQVGELAEKLGDDALALQAFRRCADYEPSNFQYAAHIVHAMLGLRQFDQARTLAAELVSSNRASTPSVELLREVYRAQGKEDQVISQLQRIHVQRPGDRAITFALSDILSAAGRSGDAEKLLLDSLQANGPDAAVVARLFDFYTLHNQTPQATRLLIQTLAARPDSLSELEPLFDRLSRGPLAGRLRLAPLLSLDVPPNQAAARFYWAARLAETLSRDAVVRSSLEQAVRVEPPFAPAYRSLLADMLSRPDWSDAQKQQQTEQLIARAASQHAQGLAMELEGLRAIRFERHAQAIASLRHAIELGDKSPDARFALAMAYLADGKGADAEQTLWALAGDCPSYDNAYLTLFKRYLNQGGEEGARQAIKVLQTWLAADPFNINARLLQVTVFRQTGRTGSAEQALSALFTEYPDNPMVIEELRQLYTRDGRTPELYRILEDQLAHHPDNRAAAAALARIYADARRASDAVRILDSLRQAVAKDPEELYIVAHLYELVNQRSTTEAVLSQVLQLDPAHAPAANDLGYMWADDGKDLDRAEQLIRQAVSAEPGNAAYLDSLGWVLYKRGKFAQARDFLERAVSGGDRPDPVVLDHLGDALYRLKDVAEARKTWQRSLDRLSETSSDREDLRKLRLMLKNKIAQQQAGKPVDVAPLAMGQSMQGGTR